MVTTEDIKKLREATGAGMMDCKKALVECDGDQKKASDWLREKGMAAAAKKQSRIAAEGAVSSYIHLGGKIGVIVEVNCETDFVAKSDKFQELTKNIAMQIAAAKPEYVRIEEVPAERVEHEKGIILAQIQNDEKMKNKPAAALERIVAGKIEKFYKEICLMEQEYIKDPSMSITQLMNEATLQLGEKLTIRRFVRYEMGEGLEKRKDDFVEEVMKQSQK